MPGRHRPAPRRRGRAGPGDPHDPRHRRGRPALRGHHQPAAVHRRRPGHGPAGRRGGRRRRVHAVPPDRPAPSGDAPAAALRGAAGPRRPGPRRPRRPLRRRAAATRRGEQGHDGPDARTGRRPRVARRDRARAPSTTASRRSPPRFAPSVSTRPTTGCPIAPAAHYLCGGVVTDLDGATVAARAVGRAARWRCTGVHGANRLASNSLLEGMVFGPRGHRGHRAGEEGPGRHRRHALRCSSGDGRRPGPGSASGPTAAHSRRSSPVAVRGASRRVRRRTRPKLDRDRRCSGP